MSVAVYPVQSVCILITCCTAVKCAHDELKCRNRHFCCGDNPHIEELVIDYFLCDAFLQSFHRGNTSHSGWEPQFTVNNVADTEQPTYKENCV